MGRLSTTTKFVIVGFVVALAFAFFVSPYASSSPDGLEKVSQDTGFDSTARDHALADGPLADYSARGIDDEGLSTGVAGLVGVTLCFALGAGLLLVVRRVRPTVKAST